MTLTEIADKLIKEEVDRLRKNGTVGMDFRVAQCLIKLPPDSKPILQFNDKIQWSFKGDTSHLLENQKIFTWDLKKFTGVQFPSHNKKKVAYIFLYTLGKSFSIAFDFTPNTINENEIDVIKHGNSKTITDYYNLYFTELQLKLIPVDIRKKMKDTGYFFTPCLFPFPFGLLTKPNIQIEKVIEEIPKFFDSTLINEIEKNWFNTEVFKSREMLIQESIDNYRNNRLASCISILIPQIEGILREFLFISQEITGKTNAQQAFEQVKFIFENENQTNVLTEIISSFSNYFSNDSGLFKSFNNWTDNINASITPRHAYSHGKYDERFYGKENCIKLFLILYTFYDMITLIENKNNSA